MLDILTRGVFAAALAAPIAISGQVNPTPAASQFSVSVIETGPDGSDSIVPVEPVWYDDPNSAGFWVFPVPEFARVCVTYRVAENYDGHSCWFLTTPLAAIPAPVVESKNWWAGLARMVKFRAYWDAWTYDLNGDGKMGVVARVSDGDGNLMIDSMAMFTPAAMEAAGLETEGNER